MIHYNGQRLATERSFRSFDDAALEQSTTDTGQPGIIMKNKEKGGALSTNHMGEFVGNPHLHELNSRRSVRLLLIELLCEQSCTALLLDEGKTLSPTLIVWPWTKVKQQQQQLNTNRYRKSIRNAPSGAQFVVCWVSSSQSQKSKSFKRTNSTL